MPFPGLASELCWDLPSEWSGYRVPVLFFGGLGSLQGAKAAVLEAATWSLFSLGHRLPVLLAP